MLFMLHFSVAATVHCVMSLHHRAECNLHDKIQINKPSNFVSATFRQNLHNLVCLVLQI